MQTPAFRPAVERAALDPPRGYAHALRDTLPDTGQVLDPFQVVKLGTRRRRPAANGDRGPRRGPSPR